MENTDPTVAKYNNQLGAFDAASNRYIDDLIGQASGDRDAAIAILTREHEQALGNNDQERAKFLESVSDSLEKRIGSIPYDYQIGVTRTNEDASRSNEITTRNRDQVLARLGEDEKTWKDTYAVDSAKAKMSQQEQLLQRGIIQGTRGAAGGLAGSEVRSLDQELGDKLSAYDRALGRSKQDTIQTAGDQIFDTNRAAGRTLDDLKTESRRSAQGVQDNLNDGKTAAQRAFEKQKKTLEQERELSKLRNQTYAASV